MGKRNRIIFEAVCHVLFWVVPAYLIVRYNLMSYSEMTGKYYRMPLIISVLINIFLVYANIFILFTGQNRKKISLTAYVLILCLMIISLALLKVKIDSAFMRHYFGRLVSDEHGRIGFELIVNSFFVLQSIFYCIVKEWIRNRRTERRLKEENLTLELKYLKSQINPHFLFNTLNNLYSVALQNNDNVTAKGIAKLSQMMRFMLDGVNENLISLEKEIDYLQSYLELQRLRFSDKDDVRIRFDIRGDTAGIKIPPFIFIVFIENAFKYGIDYKKHSFIDMLLEISGKTLNFNIKNSVHKPYNPIEEGIGLKNIMERLDLLYPGNYSLKLAPGSDIFNLDLSIRLS